MIVAASAIGAMACGPGSSAVAPPTGQILLHFDTDAPVPAAPGKMLAQDEPAPLFDTLSVEVFEPGQTEPCRGCAREFAVDLDKLRAGALSIGIPTRPGIAGYRVRVRLFPVAWLTACPADGAGVATGEAVTRLYPRPEATIEVTAELPPVGVDGIVDRTVFLATDAVGVAQGSLAAPAETSEGTPGVSKVGSWPGAQRVICAGEPRPDEVCVPGGAYWMGNPRARTDCGAFSSTNFLVPHLVVLSPFFLQMTEVTVGQFRSGGGDPRNIRVWGGRYNSGSALADRCTFTKSPGPHESVPINCIEWSNASDFCRKRGGDLPTEAQWEFVGSGLSSRFYVWGEEPPTCDDSVWGRAAETSGSAFPCSQPKSDPGVRAVDADSLERYRRLDRLSLPTGTVFDLMGNVAENTLDFYDPPNGSCWSQSGILTDPVCERGTSAGRAFRGSAWLWGPGNAASRGGLPALQSAVSIGFRCARPGI
ncbi:MAG: formylglycine-generating enzyme family protein [Deltaproteobacteria bacterium]|nr:formylglycine-generating enzyme family protein [Deltaproteobacteria bacterium]